MGASDAHRAPIWITQQRAREINRHLGITIHEAVQPPPFVDLEQRRT